MSVSLPGMGRLFAPDSRDHAFMLATAEAVRDPLPKNWPLFARWINQKRTGTCVGHGFRHLLTGVPKPMRNPLPTPFEIYDRAILIDEWASNDVDLARQFGTSVRAGAKVLQEMGLISGYGWIFDLEGALDFLSYTGPLVIGVNWYDSMFERDKDRFLRIAPGAKIAGGHCVLVNAINPAQGWVQGLTSWENFGYFRLSFGDFDRLIREDGECCSPTEALHRVGVVA